MKVRSEIWARRSTQKYRRLTRGFDISGYTLKGCSPGNCTAVRPGLRIRWGCSIIGLSSEDCTPGGLYISSSGIDVTSSKILYHRVANQVAKRFIFGGAVVGRRSLGHLRGLCSGLPERYYLRINADCKLLTSILTSCTPYHPPKSLTINEKRIPLN